MSRAMLKPSRVYVLLTLATAVRLVMPDGAHWRHNNRTSRERLNLCCVSLHSERQRLVAILRAGSRHQAFTLLARPNAKDLYGRLWSIHSNSAEGLDSRRPIVPLRIPATLGRALAAQFYSAVTDSDASERWNSDCVCADLPTLLSNFRMLFRFCSDCCARWILATRLGAVT